MDTSIGWPYLENLKMLLLYAVSQKLKNLLKKQKIIKKKGHTCKIAHDNHEIILTKRVNLIRLGQKRSFFHKL